MADTIFCNKCGTPLDAQARFCVKCGDVIASAPTAQPAQPPSATATAAAAAPAFTAPPASPAAMAAPPASAPPAQYGSVPQAYVPAAAPAMAPAMPGVLPYAGFWVRVGAYLIDFLVLLVPASILGFIPILGIVLDIVGIWLYFALQESSAKQATIGKRAMNLYVTDLQGRRISFGQATGRYFGKIISGIILDIGFIMVAFTERKQGLHDMMAGTLVMRK